MIEILQIPSRSPCDVITKFLRIEIATMLAQQRHYHDAVQHMHFVREHINALFTFEPLEPTSYFPTFVDRDSLGGKHLFLALNQLDSEIQYSYRMAKELPQHVSAAYTNLQVTAHHNSQAALFMLPQQPLVAHVPHTENLTLPGTQDLGQPLFAWAEYICRVITASWTRLRYIQALHAHAIDTLQGDQLCPAPGNAYVPCRDHGNVDNDILTQQVDQLHSVRNLISSQINMYDNMLNQPSRAAVAGQFPSLRTDARPPTIGGS
jgi:hypothetical protein